MTTKEAIQAMLAGNKVRINTWKQNEYAYITDDGNIIDEKGILFVPITSSNYEIYEEPKPKETVTIEKWLIALRSGYTVIEGTREYLLNTPYQLIKLISTYELNNE